ncbi:phage terminase large subunit [Bacteroides faecis]|nr:phage terminase large subunit [Bacteroides faecis]
MSALESNRFNVYVFEGGSRSSKTYSLIQFFIVYAINNWQRSNRIVIARKKGTWLSSTVWTDFKNILLETGLYNDCKINNTLKTIQMYSTSFEFVGA